MFFLPFYILDRIQEPLLSTIFKSSLDSRSMFRLDILKKRVHWVSSGIECCFSIPWCQNELLRVGLWTFSLPFVLCSPSTSPLFNLSPTHSSSKWRQSSLMYFAVYLFWELRSSSTIRHLPPLGFLSSSFSLFQSPGSLLMASYPFLIVFIAFDSSFISFVISVF